MTLRIDDLLDELKKAALRRAITKSALAADAGLHENTLQDMYKPTWAPSVSTIRALEKVLFAGA